MANNTWLRLQRFLALCLLVTILACCGNTAAKVSKDTIDSIARICREGDIVLRKGVSMESHLIASADGQSSYTHCGIIARMGDSIVVVHAVPYEPDFDGDVDRVKAESLRSFFSEKRASGGCLLRCNASHKIARRSAQKAVELFRRGTLFDHSFNCNDTTKMYCSELVEYVYLKNGITIIGTGQHNYNVPGLRLQNVIFPSDFLEAKRVRVVKRF